MNLSQDVSELIACLTEKDKVIDSLQKNQCRLLEKQKQEANFESRLAQVNQRLGNFDKLYQQMEKKVKT